MGGAKEERSKPMREYRACGDKASSSSKRRRPIDRQLSLGTRARHVVARKEVVLDPNELAGVNRKSRKHRAKYTLFAALATAFLVAMSRSG